MSSNVREFNFALGEFGKSIGAEQSKLHRAVTLEALKGVVMMTPVDSGRARANWQVTQDEPAGGELEAFDKSGGPTIARGAAQALIPSEFGVTYISNNVPYIEELENGSSKQAPSGMLTVTYNRLSAWLGRMR